ncbi:GNAT family N-acetyltransferase [Nitratireductor rhodophyticola]|uniref:GNAT family N-acetyltransferase n=1 Tax=Nitratireductor rhodophyticola TaxID=2854036 RepID=UPI002AC8A8D8|nr:GNAT family N-acetyltransferase [Nitratireductor rhodophyticola]WPZ15330.1 GNAT family N-acetyltransferase [Nitratireductor rhodophyticola]
MEARAARLFAAHGYAALAATPAMASEAFDRIALENQTLVAEHETDGAVGFAICGAIGPFLHLKELSVAPEHGKRGLGTALLSAVVGESVSRGLDGVSLSTFRAVPFNAPFYARHGFVEQPLISAPEALRERFFSEIPPGIAAESRVLMLRRNRPG